MSSSNCCFLTCIQVSQGQVAWYFHFFKNFPQFVVIHTVKGFGIVHKAEIDVFLELSCFFDDLTIPNAKKGCAYNPSGSILKNPAALVETQKMWVQSLGQKDLLKEGKTALSSILACRIPWTVEPGGLQSIISQIVRHDRSDWALITCFSLFPWFLSFEMFIELTQHTIQLIVPSLDFKWTVLSFRHKDTHTLINGSTFLTQDKSRCWCVRKKHLIHYIIVGLLHKLLLVVVKTNMVHSEMPNINGIVTYTNMREYLALHLHYLVASFQVSWIEILLTYN